MTDYKPFVGRRVVVGTTESVVSGTLDRAGRTTLQLVNAMDVGSQKPVDGVLVVPESQVLWVQVP
ncbi:hypothetical protein [Nocardioides jensenii]|uniref:hypothetical protein n=1 Tax=Nocardioides jensenii TaxID=1843 RepID=UPI000833F09F|nr:hypothetical protein [Nocardioides jensenii]